MPHRVACTHTPICFILASGAHAVTRLITMATAIAPKMNIEEANHPGIPELARDVRPGKVMDTTERQKEKMESELKNGRKS